MGPIPIIVHLGVLWSLLAAEATADLSPTEPACSYGENKEDLEDDQSQLFGAGGKGE
jgi:hypothetical protein